MRKLMILFPGIGYHCDKPILYYINDSGIEYPYFNKLFGMSAYPKDDCFE